jgi:hypothetical protein
MFGVLRGHTHLQRRERVLDAVVSSVFHTLRIIIIIVAFVAVVVVGGGGGGGGGGGVRFMPSF